MNTFKMHVCVFNCSVTYMYVLRYSIVLTFIFPLHLYIQLVVDHLCYCVLVIVSVITKQTWSPPVQCTVHLTA